MSLTVVFRGREVFRQPILDVDDGLSVAEFLASLCEENHVAVEYSKLVLRGHVLAGSDGDGATPLKAALEGARPRGVGDLKILLIGSAAEEVETLLDAEEKGVAQARTIRSDMDDGAARAERERKLQSGLYTRYVERGPAPSPYRFQRIRTLPGLPDEDRARRVLEELANDPGVLRVMETRRWTVGCLSELYPEGRVGTDVCLLGLNKNKGQEILLRLRTDDLTSFRKVHMLRDVLFHELAHNVFSEHDNNFKALMNEIRREASEMDWRRQRGRTADGRLAGGGGFERSPAGMAPRSEQTMIIRDLSGRRPRSAFSGGSGALGMRAERAGGEEDAAGAMDLEDSAADDGFCEVCAPPEPPPAEPLPSPPEPPAREDKARGERAAEAEEALGGGALAGAGAAGEGAAGEGAAGEGAAEAPPRSAMSAEEEAMLAASFAEMGPAGERLRSAVEAMASGEGAASAKVVLTMLGNILAAPEDERFHRVRETNRTVAKRVMRVPQAAAVLEASGFSWRGAAPERELVWTRRDVALVFAARALLEVRAGQHL